jgi:hypothetical protein
MRRWIWLAVLILYGTAAAVDSGVRAGEAVRAGEKFGPAVLTVAFCAGLFWPIDIVARMLLASR